MNRGKTGIIVAIFAVAIVFTMMIITLWAPYISPFDPLDVDMQSRLKAPSSAHLLGTDAMGRDYLSRVIHGGRVSVILSLVVTSLGMVVGLIAGIIGGYFGGITDSVILGITNIFLGLPGMTLIIAIAGAMGPGVTTLLVALSLTGWMGFSRIIRGEVMKIKQVDFMDAALAMGASHWFVISRHLIPNMRAVILVTFTTRVSRAMILISSLSYLGFGLEPPAPDWGVMVRDALNYFRSAPHLILAPGACIFLLVFNLNIISDFLRDYFDVREDAVQG